MQLAHDHGDALQHVHRLEARDDAGDAVLLGQEPVRLRADDGAHVAGQDERVQLELRVVDDGLQRTGHVLVGAEHGEVLEAGRSRALDGHGNERRGGLEAHAHEHDLAVGVLLGERQRVERRVHDLYAAAGGLLLEQARRGAGHARHIAERGDGDVVGAREGDNGVDVAVRRHAHRAAGAGRQADALGHEVADAVARDGHRVRAAHLHERGAARGGELLDGVDQAAREFGVLERRELGFHRGGVDRARLVSARSSRRPVFGRRECFT